MRTRTNKVIEMARMMIKQAKMLKDSGFRAEARKLARRAVALNALGHTFANATMEPVPVRLPSRRTRH